MSKAQASASKEFDFCGPANCSMTGSKSASAVAQRTANYFMANMGSDVFPDDQAYSISLAGKAGIKNAGLNFMTTDNSYKSPSSAPTLPNGGIELS